MEFEWEMGKGNTRKPGGWWCIEENGSGAWIIDLCYMRAALYDDD
jgi:hypothetical protein